MRKKLTKVQRRRRKEARESAPAYRARDRAHRNARKLGVSVETWKEMLAAGIVRPRQNIFRLRVRNLLAMRREQVGKEDAS